MTITDPGIIHTMLANDGVYPGDPQASSIWKYTTAHTGAAVYAVFMHEEHNDIHLSPYVQDPILLWSRTAGLTLLGACELG